MWGNMSCARVVEADDLLAGHASKTIGPLHYKYKLTVSWRCGCDPFYGFDLHGHSPGPSIKTWRENGMQESDLEG